MCVLVLGVCAVIAASAGEARAQMTFGTFKGYLTGHVGVVSGGDVTSERMAAGASIAVYESNGWGAEIDFGRSTDVATNTYPLSLTSYMVNAGVGQTEWPRAAVRGRRRRHPSG